MGNLIEISQIEDDIDFIQIPGGSTIKEYTYHHFKVGLSEEFEAKSD